MLARLLLRRGVPTAFDGGRMVTGPLEERPVNAVKRRTEFSGSNRQNQAQAALPKCSEHLGNAGHRIPLRLIIEDHPALGETPGRASSGVTGQRRSRAFSSDVDPFRVKTTHQNNIIEPRF